MEGEITPTSATPSSCCSFEYFVTSRDESFEIQKRRLLREIDEMNCRYEDCFRRLQLSISEIDHLRDENLRLSAENLELLFLVEELEASAATGGVEPDHASDEKKEAGDNQNPSLTQISGRGKGESRGGTPKSISIRSSGFHTVKTSPLSWRKGAGARAAASDTKRTHRLRLQGGDGETGEEARGEVEVDVFDQGTVKTELCNKWGELGWCPYGSRCQFAHGLGELRPVIRHPRYKTQLCRMLSSPDGSGCPYGHRCHFRHSLPKSP